MTVYAIQDTVSRFECPTWNMKEQKVKPRDIFTFKPRHPSCFTRKLDCLTTLHNFSSRFSCNFWLKQEFYLLLGESMLTIAKVNFCNERLPNQAELKFYTRFDD